MLVAVDEGRDVGFEIARQETGSTSRMRFLSVWCQRSILPGLGMVRCTMGRGVDGSLKPFASSPAI